MTVSECMLSVDVEGRKNHLVGCGCAAAGGPLAWRVRDLNCWLITDGRAGGSAGASENKRLSPDGRSAAEAREACHDCRRAVEAPERTDRRARSPGDQFFLELR